ncbi:MAG: response regulator, partial [SAR324 cluster bacterium]|nr:response regulator [SAR324 cluster bacterium]
PSCAREAAIDPSLVAQLPDILRTRLNGKFKIGRGCEKCGHLGYLGKVGIKSFVKNSETFEDAFLAGLEHSDLISLSYDEGAVSLIEDGIEKVNEGIISLDALYEVIKVIPEACLKHLYKMSESNASSEKILSIPDDYFLKQPDETQNQKPLIGATALVPNPESIAAALNEPVLQIKTDKKRATPLLLVVEDDPDQRSILEMLFRGAGYDIMSASDGIEAFQQIEKTVPDLIISDLMMPRMDGGQFVKKLKSIEKLRRIPVLMLTVVSDVQKEYELLDLGADDYCEKTIQRKILLKRIENLLKRT